MAKSIAPLFSLRARGSINRVITFLQRREGVSVQKYPSHIDAGTAAQLEQRSYFQGGVACWHTLTAEEKSVYAETDPNIGANPGYLNFLRRWLMGEVPVHHTRHEDGGADEVSIAGLSGLLLTHLANVNVPAPVNGYVLTWHSATSLWIASAPYGVVTFLGLTDTPGTYVDQGGKAVSVKDNETGLEFAAAPSASKIWDADHDTWVDTEKYADEDIIRMGHGAEKLFHLISSGILSLPLQSVFHAYRSAAQTIPNATWTRVAFNIEEFDVHGEYDHVTNFRFTATVAGKYLAASICGLDGMGDGKVVTLIIKKNGAVWEGARRMVTSTTGAAAGLCFSGSGIIDLAANDFLDVWIYHTDIAARDTPAEPMSVSFEVGKLF